MSYIRRPLRRGGPGQPPPAAEPRIEDHVLQDMEERLVWMAQRPDYDEYFAKLFPRIMSRFVHFQWGADTPFRRYFNTWQDAGFTLLPTHHYSPIPHVHAVPEETLRRNLALEGVKLDFETQEALIGDLVRDFGAELGAIKQGAPAGDFEFFHGNGEFESVDAELIYALLRKHKPKRVVEIGSGFNTIIAADALRKNASEGHEAEFVTIDPAPSDRVRKGVKGLTRLITQKATEAPLDLFEALEANDVLLIDSSHTVSTGSDCERVFFEILPLLKPGVLVHLHDIFLPRPYPRDWVASEHVFWNEQYYLAAFLTFNDQYETLVAANALHQRRSPALAKLSPVYNPETTDPGSFWIRRR